ncbi:BrnT family toxin [Dapis sp. BLCC M172]|uniref:BrnT family toxin n=1 Tax=Dapis sp. BLCC M172 TaxID=2975281 RepID=UPI003CEE391C
MNVFYQRQGVEFEWDSNKAQSNLEKHGISFEEATEAFFDPFYQEGGFMNNPEEEEFTIKQTAPPHSRESFLEYSSRYLTISQKSSC